MTIDLEIGKSGRDKSVVQTSTSRARHRCTRGLAWREAHGTFLDPGKPLVMLGIEVYASGVRRTAAGESAKRD
jgi:hypothetical protein